MKATINTTKINDILTISDLNGLIRYNANQEKCGATYYTEQSLTRFRDAEFKVQQINERSEVQLYNDAGSHASFTKEVQFSAYEIENFFSKKF